MSVQGLNRENVDWKYDVMAGVTEVMSECKSNVGRNLLAKAKAVTWIIDISALLRCALISLVKRESAGRLAKLGGSEPELKSISRRRSAT